MGCILSFAPLDFVDLLFNLQGFEVVKFGFVGLEFGMELVFTSFFLVAKMSALWSKLASTALIRQEDQSCTYGLVSLE